MGLIFNDLNAALSVKSCYSRFIRISSVILLLVLLPMILFVDDVRIENQGHLVISGV